ncbi:MAG: hypothetical protein AAF633_08545 [Chloroflexota bacterium]
MKQYKHRFTLLPLLIFCMTFMLAGCDLIAPAEPAPVPTATPDGNLIFFQTDAYRLELTEGGVVPGTQLRFISYDENTSEFLVSIDGRSTLKKSGDSFEWEGVLAPGVLSDFELILSQLTFGEPFTSGQVTLTILNPNPVELDATLPPPPATFVFEDLDISYRVPLGRVIPGTQLSYGGTSDNGAVLNGTAGSPFRRENDSLIWQGSLTENVTLRYDLTVAEITETEMALIGTGTIWIDKRDFN